MKYVVWLSYYVAAPVSKSVKSDELTYYNGHSHGVQPSQVQVNSLQTSLQTNVEKACLDKGTAYPGDQAVQEAREVNTKSVR